MKVRALLAAALLSCSLSLSAATEVIPLNFRTADEVLSVVQSVLGHEGKVNAYGNQLIVNAEPAKIAEVRALLQQLDTEPRRLLISVDTNESGFQSDRGYRADGTISAGDAEVQIGQGEINGRDQVRIIRRSTDSRSGGTQQVQATEGYPALIQVGQSVPLTTRGRDAYGQPYASANRKRAPLMCKVPIRGSAGGWASGSTLAALASRARASKATLCDIARPRAAKT